MQNKSYTLIDKGLSEIKENILATFAYFDLFSYPLTRGELYLFLANKYPSHVFDNALNNLVLAGIIYQFGKFYTLKNDYHLVIKRINGNKKATERIKLAERAGKILIRFPYVRGVAISGPISKNFADDFSEIDLFIITAENRLWIARTIIRGFKNLIFLVDKGPSFCMNHYLDTQQLEIAEKNIDTAIRICTLIPLEGDIEFERFYNANTWTRDYLPNNIMRVSSAGAVKNSILKNVFEYLFNGAAGDAIDDLLMRITARSWLKKTQGEKLNNDGVIMVMKAGKHFAKPDPKHFQGKLLARFQDRVALLLRQYKGDLTA